VVVIGTLKNTLGPHHGNPPLGTVEGPPLVVLGAITVALGGAAAVGFRRRGVPQH
jgi:hypothetical protein